jgi:hypothetical protein
MDAVPWANPCGAQIGADEARAPDYGDRVLRGVQFERNSEALSNAEKHGPEPNRARRQWFGRIVVPVAAGSSPVAHPS